MKPDKKRIGFMKMRDVKTGITVIFIWLAWMVLTAHLIVPHDHHLADSFAREDGRCPSSDSKSNHNGFPLHCHAFNGIASEKATQYVLVKNIQNYDSQSGCLKLQTISKFLISQITIFEDNEPLKDYYLLSFTPLRAPPSIVL